MSVEAITWAFAVNVKPSTAKFVLVAMANCASTESMLAWPSVAYLAQATGQDRKTVLSNLSLLRDQGFIEDTGKRAGATKQVHVYRLNSTKTGTVKQAQERDSTESGTVPDFPPNSPVFPSKESRFSHETVPKTGHGTVRNLQGTVREPKREKRARGSRFCPDDFKPDADLFAWARREHPSVDPAKETEAFMDHEFSKPYTDWRRTWKRWIRNAEKFASTAGGQGRRESTADHNARAFDEWMAQEDDGRTIDA